VLHSELLVDIQQLGDDLLAADREEIRATPSTATQAKGGKKGKTKAGVLGEQQALRPLGSGFCGDLTSWMPPEDPQQDLLAAASHDLRGPLLLPRRRELRRNLRYERVILGV
jgi:hypothetical protein